MKPIVLTEEPSKGYSFNGAPALNDGIKGNGNYKTGRWLGFQGKDIVATFDLKEATEISKIRFATNVVKGDWDYGCPSGLCKCFRTMARLSAKWVKRNYPKCRWLIKDGLFVHELDFTSVKAKYVTR